VKKIRIQEKKNNLKYLKTIQVSRIQESGVRIPPPHPNPLPPRGEGI